MLKKVLLIGVRQLPLEEAADENVDAEAEAGQPEEVSPTAREVETTDPRSGSCGVGMRWGFTKEPKIVSQRERSWHTQITTALVK